MFAPKATVIVKEKLGLRILSEKDMDLTQTDPNLGDHVAWELLEARHVPPRLRV